MRVKIICVVFVGVAFCICATANAGVLTDHASAYNDGQTIWRGSTILHKDNGEDTLTVRVECAVFGRNVFPFAGYTPTVNHFSYVYQLYPTGTLEVNKFWVNMLQGNQAKNIGSFALPDSMIDVDSVGWGTQDPQDLQSAIWNFDGDLTPPDQISYGLVYTSINGPVTRWGFAQDGGIVATPQGPLPSPSDVIPEPASMVLLAIGGVFIAGRRERKNK
jgi:hypothetical protein